MKTVNNQFHASLKRSPFLASLVAGAILSAGCGSDHTVTTRPGWLDAPAANATSALTYEQFRAQAQSFASGEPDGYIIESHIKVYSEESLHTYYDAIYQSPVKKSVGWTISGSLGKRSTPTNISYCFSNGWGAPIGSVTAPAKSTIVDQVALGAKHWRGVTKVVFQYRSDLDGASCTTANIANGTLPVSFVVKPYDSSCTASGAFPWMAASDQALSIPSCGLPGYLADHELGHILGLRHEMEHSQNDCGSSVAAQDTDLTSYDRNSVMFYSNCTGDASSRAISSLDGVGVRKLYGAPDWWWSPFFTL